MDRKSSGGSGAGNEVKDMGPTFCVRPILRVKCQTPDSKHFRRKSGKMWQEGTGKMAHTWIPPDPESGLHKMNVGVAGARKGIKCEVGVVLAR